MTNRPSKAIQHHLVKKNAASSLFLSWTISLFILLFKLCGILGQTGRPNTARHCMTKHGTARHATIRHGGIVRYSGPVQTRHYDPTVTVHLKRSNDGNDWAASCKPIKPCRARASTTAGIKARPWHRHDRPRRTGPCLSYADKCTI